VGLPGWRSLVALFTPGGPSRMGNWWRRNLPLNPGSFQEAGAGPGGLARRDDHGNWLAALEAWIPSSWPTSRAAPQAGELQAVALLRPCKLDANSCCCLDEPDGLPGWGHHRRRWRPPAPRSAQARAPPVHAAMTVRQIQRLRSSHPGARRYANQSGRA